MRLNWYWGLGWLIIDGVGIDLVNCDEVKASKVACGLEADTAAPELVDDMCWERKGGRREMIMDLIFCEKRNACTGAMVALALTIDVKKLISRGDKGTMLKPSRCIDK